MADDELDLSELESHTQQLLTSGKTPDKIFEFVAYMNVNEVGTHMVVGEKVLEEDAIETISEGLDQLDVDLAPLGQLADGLTGGETVKRALAGLFLELTEICDMAQDEDEEEPGELTEEALLLLNFIKHFNPQMRRLTVALTEADGDDVSCEYEVSSWMTQ